MALKLMFLLATRDAGPERQNTVSRETYGHRRRLIERMASGRRAAFHGVSFVPAVLEPRSQSRPVSIWKHPNLTFPIAIFDNCD
jgi:hypothetical protein